MSRPKVQAGGIIRTSLDNSWKTPQYVLDAARVYFGGPIPFDAATASDNPTDALRYAALPVGTLQGPSLFPEPERVGTLQGPSLFPEPERVGTLQGPDGLSMSWDWPTWVNPPYGENLKDWLSKMKTEAKRGAEVLALVPCSRWEQGYFTDVLAAANALCFHRGRIAFISSIDNVPVEGNPSASMFLGFNADPERFVRAFATLGACFSLRPLTKGRVIS